VSKTFGKQQPASSMVTFYHDIEQNIDSKANPRECRKIVKEFLKLEKKYGIAVTYNVVGKIFQEQPDLIEWILQEGQEVAFHSYNHQSDWQPKYYSDEVDLCSRVSSLPRGYRSPQSQWNQDTLKTLWRKGFLWNAENDKHKEPYFIYKGLVRLPIAADDWPLQTGTMNVDEWVQQFSKLLKRRPYFAFGSHDCVTSFASRERLEAWERVLRIAVENEALLGTFSEAADLFRRAALARYYDNTAAKNWDRFNKTLYRTKRFQELIRVEAEKLNQPIVADLGSGGGLLSRHLKDIAGKTYCVGNASDMLEGIGSDSCVQACPGEAIDSNLPDNSIDLVICAHTIEHLFWPDRLADEIKRIGKIGATYFVTVSALRDTPPSGEAPPSRIGHYFTPDEVQRWASQIGPGHLIGIQYEEPEPDSPETEQRYRAMEKNPSGCVPMHWVYIGTIQKEFTAKNHRETIPLSAFDFRFPSQRYDHLKTYLENVGRRLFKAFSPDDFALFHRIWQPKTVGRN